MRLSAAHSPRARSRWPARPTKPAEQSHSPPEAPTIVLMVGASSFLAYRGSDASALPSLLHSGNHDHRARCGADGDWRSGGHGKSSRVGRYRKLHHVGGTRIVYEQKATARVYGCRIGIGASGE